MNYNATEEECLENENDIIWIKRINNLDYVRQGYNSWNRKYTITKSLLKAYGYIVGYSVLKNNSKTARRLFYLKKYDRCNPNNTGKYKNAWPIGTCPTEGVDPYTVSIGKAGERNAYACGLEPGKERIYKGRI
jgi:hypothetical protein